MRALNEAIISGLVRSDRMNNALSEMKKYLNGQTTICLSVEAILFNLLYMNQFEELKVAPLLLEAASS